MEDSQSPRIAMWLADSQNKTLPSALLQELDNVCGAVVLCGSDSQLDNALEKAMRAGADAEWLGVGLLILSMGLDSDAVESRHSGDEDEKDLLARSARAAEAASRVLSKSKNCERLWGRARAILCSRLRSLSELNSGKDVHRINLRCVEAGEDAVRTLQQKDGDSEWIEARTNLAGALRDLALQESKQERSRRLLERAIQAHEEAFGELERRGERPDEAVQLNRFALTMLEYADILGKEEACNALDRAAAAEEKAEKILSEQVAKFPRNQDWRVELTFARENLGFANMLRADYESGGIARKLYSRAVEAYEASLQGRSRESDPDRWADIQTGLAHSLFGLARNSSATVRDRFWQRAIAAYEAALEVFTPEDYPEQCSHFNELLAITLHQLLEGKKGKKARSLLARIVSALEKSLDSHTMTTDPLREAHMKLGLAKNLRELSNLETHSNGQERHRRALELCESAITVIDRMDKPFNQPMPRNTLGNICFELATRCENKDESMAFWEKAKNAYYEGIELCVGEAAVWKPELIGSLKCIADIVQQDERS